MGDNHNFMKRLEKLFKDCEGDPDEVFTALDITGSSDEDRDDSDDENDLFNLDTTLQTTEKEFKNGEQEQFCSNENLSDNEQPTQTFYTLQPAQLNDPLDDFLSLSDSQSVLNDGVPVTSPSTLKDAQVVPSTSKDSVNQVVACTTKTTLNTKKSPAQSIRKSSRKTSPKPKFARRREAVNQTPAPPEYQPKSKVKNMNWLPRKFCDNCAECSKPMQISRVSF